LIWFHFHLAEESNEHYLTLALMDAASRILGTEVKIYLPPVKTKQQRAAR
jgi:hypothetical protein